MSLALSKGPSLYQVYKEPSTVLTQLLSVLDLILKPVLEDVLVEEHVKMVFVFVLMDGVVLIVA